MIDGVVIDLLLSDSDEPEQRRCPRLAKRLRPPPTSKPPNMEQPSKPPNMAEKNKPVNEAPGNELFHWKQIETQLRCDICKSLMDVPVSLSKCFHTFCSLCIRRDFELGNNEGKCPCCRMTACSSDIRMEPRLAQIIKILATDNTRKKIRKKISLKDFHSDAKVTNATFVRQAKLASLFALGGDVLGRTVLPLYNNLKEKQLKDLIVADGLADARSIANLPRDALVKLHKEFVLSCQAAFDANRMGMYPLHAPTKEGMAKFFRFSKNLFSAESAVIDRLTADAQRSMRTQLEAAIKRRVASN